MRRAVFFWWLRPNRREHEGNSPGEGKKGLHFPVNFFSLRIRPLPSLIASGSTHFIAHCFVRHLGHISHLTSPADLEQLSYLLLCDVGDVGRPLSGVGLLAGSELAYPSSPSGVLPSPRGQLRLTHMVVSGFQESVAIF